MSVLKQIRSLPAQAQSEWLLAAAESAAYAMHPRDCVNPSIGIVYAVGTDLLQEEGGRTLSLLEKITRYDTILLLRLAAVEIFPAHRAALGNQDRDVLSNWIVQKEMSQRFQKMAPQRIQSILALG